MITYNKTHVRHSAVYAMVASGAFVALSCMAFFLAEPTISIGQETASSTFRIRQTITDESSFLVPPTNVTMVGSINGVTGGNATGTTDFVVQSNNTAGYYVEIAFYDNTTPEAMIGDVDQDEAIRDYDGDVGGQPSPAFSASTSALFAYTVTSDTPSDTDQSFLENAGNCNQLGGTQSIYNCWKAPATTGFRIVDRSVSATNGATSTLTFRVNVPSGAVPVPQAETYTATATLSLFVK